MDNLLLNGPGQEPVSLQQLRDYLHVNGDDDTFLSSLVTAARLMVEAQTGLRLITQDWRVHVNRWQDSAIELPIWPVQKIISIESLLDGGGVIDVDTYELVKAGRPALIILGGNALPAASSTRLGVGISLTAGYGDSADEVPETLSFAVLALAAHWYDIDDWNHLGPERALPPVVKTIIDEYRVVRI